MVSKPRKVHYKNKRKISPDAISLVNVGKVLKRKDYNSGTPDLTPSSFMTQCQLTALERQQAFKETKSCIKGPAPKIPLKNAWQVEQGKISCSEQSCGEGDQFKIDLRVQGVFF